MEPMALEQVALERVALGDAQPWKTRSQCTRATETGRDSIVREPLGVDLREGGRVLFCQVWSGLVWSGLIWS